MWLLCVCMSVYVCVSRFEPGGGTGGTFDDDDDDDDAHSPECKSKNERRN